MYCTDLWKFTLVINQSQHCRRFRVLFLTWTQMLKYIILSSLYIVVAHCLKAYAHVISRWRGWLQGMDHVTIGVPKHEPQHTLRAPNLIWFPHQRFEGTSTAVTLHRHSLGRVSSSSACNRESAAHQLRLIEWKFTSRLGWFWHWHFKSWPAPQETANTQIILGQLQGKWCKQV